MLRSSKRKAVHNKAKKFLKSAKNKASGSSSMNFRKDQKQLRQWTRDADLASVFQFLKDK